LGALQRESHYELVKCDLLTAGLTALLRRDFTHVFHLAAIVGVRNVVGQPYRVLHDNALMLTRVIEWAREQPKLQRLVFASTSEVYAGTLETHGLPTPTPEATPLTISPLDRPRTSYMLSKIYGEALCQLSGLPFTIVRPHNVYGPRMGMAHVVPELMQRTWESQQGGALDVYSPEHRRSFCYVDDATELLMRLALAPAGAGGTFNLGADIDEIRILDLARMVTGIVGRPLRLVPREETVGSPTRRKPDLSAAIRVSGYTPCVPLGDGLRLTWDWYHAAISTAAEIADMTA